MGFYDEIANYYDDLFPTGEAQLNFIHDLTPEPPKNILDVACGSGGYSIALARDGHTVTGIDLDAVMIEHAVRKAQESKTSVNFKNVNMLEINQFDQDFDTIFCIGNSLVHLNHKVDIKDFLKQAYDLLDHNGNLLLQIINFDRVIEKGITELPTITKEEKDIYFKRNYQKDGQHILFNTTLQVKNQTFNNSIPLYPLLGKDLIQMLQDIGYANITSYGDFKRSAFNSQESYHLIVTATK